MYLELYFSPAGLPATRLGTFLENRVNDFLRRQNHPEAGEVTVRVVHASDKTVEVKPGMKARYVLSISNFSFFWARWKPFEFTCMLLF